MKLEVGMYVRTKWGRIGKIINISESFDVTNIDNPISYERYEVDTNYNFEDEPDGYFKEDIKGEPSFNIIDLIEVGDYVNGHKITEIVNGIVKGVKTEYRLNSYYVYFCFYEQDIESIVTKEQFKSISYEVSK